MKIENFFIRDFYDQFSVQLGKNGYNQRIYSIYKWLIKFGVKPNYNVLEVGCGPGQSTVNFTKLIRTGKIVGVDISSENIKMAKELHKNNSDTEFIVSDMTDFTHHLKFDVICLPDVLEHILIEQHHNLFKVLRSVLKDDGKVIIHIPDPEYLEFVRQNEKEKLQITDQPIHTDIIASSLKGTGLRITYLESYSLETTENDYQIICLEPNDLNRKYVTKPWDRTLKSRIRRRINTILGKESLY